MGMPLSNGVREDIRQLRELNEHSKNLVKHSKALTGLTIGLIVTTLGMIGLAAAQLVALMQ
ncbi:hypothetical protein ACFLXK_05000 [Chloroflexota bacterium]